MARIDYRPANLTMWDTWGFDYKGTAHMFYLERIMPNSGMGQNRCHIGHATSNDLLHWQEQRPALWTNPLGTVHDDLQGWTGCALEHEDVFYLYYTMRYSGEDAWRQRIGLCRSFDQGQTWERYDDNPVVVPDSRWYVSHEAPLMGLHKKGLVDCRDLMIVPDEDRGGWLGFYAARVLGDNMIDTPCIATVRSNDLLHWESLPPAFVPKKYACVEVPDVMYLDGRWYLICLAGNHYGNRGVYDNPRASRGTIYAVADRPEGPYHELPDDHTLFSGGQYCGYCCRGMRFGGTRYAFFTQPSADGLDTVSPPYEYRTIEGGKLRLGYSLRQAGHRGEALLQPNEPVPVKRLSYNHPTWPQYSGVWQLEGGQYQGKAEKGWQVADLGVGGADLEYAVTVSLEQGVALGLALHSDFHLDTACEDIVFALDAQEQAAFTGTLASLEDMVSTPVPVEYGRAYQLRVCLRDTRLDCYVDDILVLQTSYARKEREQVTAGLFIDRGQGKGYNVSLFELKG